ncbi:AsmA-like C-terminal domain-containing protein [Inquilinus limosus]|uniref:YhdP family protein n=1 Tax=Inquilinus limosus TaxID=171674 RepID=UPI0004125CFE|nr:AsmA-like C-terminal domain-containing protein [Inquilinus limosus]
MRALKILAEIVGLAVAGVALAAVVLAWRLSSGPMEIDFLTPYVEQAISDNEASVEIGALALRWEGFDRPVVLAARNVRVRQKDGALIAIVPESSANVSMPKLLRGVVAPSRIDLIRPHLRVTRTEAGEFSFGLEASESGEGGASTPAEGAPTRDVVKDLLAALDARIGSEDSPIASLTRLTLVDGSVRIDDRLLGRSWLAPKASADLRRTPTGVDGRASLAVVSGGGTAQFGAEIHYLRASRSGRATVTFANVVPAALTRISPVLAPLEAIESPVSGRVEADFDSRFQPTGGRFSLTSINTTLRLPPLWTAPFSVARTSLSGTVDLPKRRLTLDDFSIDFGGPKISLSGQVDAVGDTIELVTAGTVAGVPVDLLDSLWPPGLPSGARAWITTNLRDGVIDRTEFSLHARAPISDPEAVTLVSADGTIQARDMTVHYFDGLPPITGLNAAASFNQSTMRIATAGGRLQDVEVQPSEITITGLDLRDQVIDIDARVEGPVKAIMSVLDVPRLGYARKMDLVPDRMSGRASARLHFGFSLLADLPFEAVRMAVEGQLSNVGIAAAKPGYDLTGTDARLTLDKSGMTLQGKGQVNAVPLTFSWREAFDDSAIETRVSAQATLNAEARAALRLPEFEPVGGTIGADLDYARRSGGAATLDAKLDLTDTRLAIDPIGWVKPPGGRANATVSLALAGDRVTKVSQFSVSGGDITASGSADFARDGSLAQLSIASFRQGPNDVKGQVEVLGPDHYRLALSGTHLDVSGILGQRRTAAGQGGASSDRSATDPAPGPRIDATFDVAELSFGDNRSLRSVHGRAIGRTTNLQDVTLAAQLPGGRPIDLRLTPQQGQPDRQILTLRSEDAGEALRVLDIAENITGGSLLATGTRNGVTGAIDGRVDARGFVLREAPGMARLLAATSPSGLQDLFGTSGLTFNRLDADFTYAAAQRRITLKQGRGAGGDLGLAFDGVIDLRAETIDLAGTIVPIYHINSVISSIPLIGDILTGGEGGGLFAFTYTIRGSFADPSVSVNPLSVLAPGFLRRLFFEETPSADGAAPRPPAQPRPQQPPRERSGGR